MYISMKIILREQVNSTFLEWIEALNVCCMKKLILIIIIIVEKDIRL